MNDEIDFLNINKHESSLQIDVMIFDWVRQTFSKLPKCQVCNVFTKSPKTSQR